MTSKFLLRDRKTGKAVRDIIADNVTALRKHREWFQVDLADKAGVCQSLVSKVERADGDCSIESLEKIGRGFGLPGWLLMIPHASVEALDSGLLSNMLATHTGGAS